MVLFDDLRPYFDLLVAHPCGELASTAGKRRLLRRFLALLGVYFPRADINGVTGGEFECNGTHADGLDAASNAVGSSMTYLSFRLAPFLGPSLLHGALDGDAIDPALGPQAMARDDDDDYDDGTAGQGRGRGEQGEQGRRRQGGKVTGMFRGRRGVPVGGV